MDGTTSHELSALLRECADIVEKGEFSAKIYKALSGLHEYAGRHPGAESPGASATNVSTSSLNGDRPRRGLGDRHGVHVQQIGAGVSSGIKNFAKGLGQRAGKFSDNLTGHQATSTKNAERARADIAEMNRTEASSYPSGSSHGPTTTAETPRMPTPIGVRSQSPMPRSTASTNSTTARPATSRKPSFQRPKNPNTNLIANGWMEQMRRSKMQKVWKAVLCSLVEGRKAGEETTLWIQREISNNGRAELEALHQIPIKWLEDVTYLDYYGDNRFSLKVYNFSEDFMFRCKDEESAMNWVLTLQSMKELVQTGKSITGGSSARAVLDETIRKVDSGDSQLPLQTNTNSAPPSPPAGSEVASTQPDPPSQQQPTQHRMPVKELRAIAHGAGINTAGMERSELEKVVSEIANKGPAATASATTAAKEGPFDEQAAEAALREEERRQAALREEERRQAALREEERRQAALLEEERRQAALRAAEEEKRKAAAEAQRKAEEEAARVEQEKRRQQQEAHAKLMAERVAKQREEEARRRREAAAEEERLRVMKEAEMRRQEEERRRAAAAAEVERQRQAEAARQHYQQQQAAWKEAERQRQAEAERQRQQQQQWQQQWQQQQQQQAAAAAKARAHQQQQYYAQQQRAQQKPNGFAGQHRQQAPPQGGAVNSKYAKMAQSDDATAAAITNIKRGILVQWALAPPHLQMLRPIGDLLCNIHKVFPPAFGVPAHEYFGKWKPITPADTAEEEKLKKAHRKLRFFLHPDKLPRDLSEEQAFMCKMLWDVSNDAMEEHIKKKDELDWIKH